MASRSAWARRLSDRRSAWLCAVSVARSYSRSLRAPAAAMPTTPSTAPNEPETVATSSRGQPSHTKSAPLATQPATLTATTTSKASMKSTATTMGTRKSVATSTSPTGSATHESGASTTPSTAGTITFHRACDDRIDAVHTRTIAKSSTQADLHQPPSVARCLRTITGRLRAAPISNIRLRWLSRRSSGCTPAQVAKPGPAQPSGIARSGVGPSLREG